MPLREKLRLAGLWVSYYPDFLNQILKRLIRIALGIDGQSGESGSFVPTTYATPKASESVSTPLLGTFPSSGEIEGEVEGGVEGAPSSQKMEQ